MHGIGGGSALPLHASRKQQLGTEHAEPRAIGIRTKNTAPHLCRSKHLIVKTYYVYLLAGRSRVLYTGMTNDLARRIRQHRAKEVPGFTQRYNVTRLVYYETYRRPADAIAREKEIKGWRRSKKVALIEAENPTWRDWGDELLGL